MPTVVDKEITLEDARRVLADALGPAYRVTATSGSTLKVSRNPVMWATVRMGWSGGRTTIRVTPGGLLLFRAINAFATAPKVRRALDQTIS